MTMPWGSTEEPEVMETGGQSIPVHVVSTDSKPGKNAPPEFGRFRTILVSSTVGPNSITPGAQRILNRSLRRHRARIIVNASLAAQPVTDGVLVGTREEITGGMPAIPGQVGGFLQIGDNVPYEAQQELWVCYPSTNASPVLVTVLDEQYASDPGSWREDANR